MHPDTDPDGEPPREASHLRENTDGDPDDGSDQQPSVSRRVFLGGGVAAIGTMGWLAYAVERAKAAVVGNVGTPSNPYSHAYVDRAVFVARTSDPSSPDDGTLWYNENA